MSGIVLESAYYGDEKAFANITQSLAKKIVGGVLDVTANGDLKPTFEAAPETKLDNRDQKRIREEAVAACGGEADQACLDRTKIKLSEERLREKETEDLSKSVIKGDRLTLNVIDNGKRRKLVTPAGQKLKLENIIGGKDAGLGDVFTGDAVQKYTLMLVGIIVSTFFWVFSIVAVYTIFMRQYKPSDPSTDYFRIVAYVASAFALLVPGSGYVIILLAFAVPAFVKEYISDKVVKPPV
jgi:hypothetical protein